MAATGSAWSEARVRSWRGGPFWVKFGGAAFMILGLLAAPVAFIQRGDVLGATATDQLLATMPPLALAALGLITIAIGMILSDLGDR